MHANELTPIFSSRSVGGASGSIRLECGCIDEDKWGSFYMSTLTDKVSSALHEGIRMCVHVCFFTLYRYIQAVHTFK